MTPAPSAVSPVSQWYGLNLSHPKLITAKRKIADWYNRGSGALVLAGDPGCGKTHIAKVVYDLHGAGGHTINWIKDEDGNTIAETVRNAVFYAEPDLFADIRESYGGRGQNEKQIISACKRSRLLILDDIGVAYIKDETLAWAYDIYWKIFDARVDKFTLITTNLTNDQIAARIGRRALSRLMEAMGSEDSIIDLFGVPDYRQRGW